VIRRAIRPQHAIDGLTSNDAHDATVRAIELAN
jgi:hypothetical protein